MGLEFTMKFGLGFNGNGLGQRDIEIIVETTTLV
jgi:hypothetical protein